MTRVATILDVGCGPGAQTIDLASACDARVIAIDTHRPYLRQLRTQSDQTRLSARIDTIEASMFALPLRANSVDVVWSEGAVYIIGFERALREWKPLLRRHGCVAATHLSWLRHDAPDAARAFWARHFPAMAPVDENLAIARRSGYAVLEHFTMPESAWWDDYYLPLERRLAHLRPQYASNPEALEAIASTQEQIDLYRRFSAFYGYVFYVLQRRGV